MNEQIAAIWARQMPQTRERVKLLQRIAGSVSGTRSIDAEDRTSALDAAHKLAGSLGMYGYMEATEHARRIEQVLDVTGLPQPERLQRHVDDLAASLAQALQD
jgi:HPt (histidine-containing phosphotransfer) domain-containing protein